MAVYFNLGIEVGKSENDAIGLVEHFSHKKIALSNKRLINVETYYFQKNNKDYVVGVEAENMNYGGVNGSEPELVNNPWYSEIEQTLYEMLRHAPPIYQTAWFGAEIVYTLEESSYTQDILEAAPHEIQKDFSKLVISRKLWEKINKPAFCRPFNEYYCWIL